MQRKKLALRMAKLECWELAPLRISLLLCIVQLTMSYRVVMPGKPSRGGEDTDELNYNSHC